MKSKAFLYNTTKGIMLAQWIKLPVITNGKQDDNFIETVDIIGPVENFILHKKSDDYGEYIIGWTPK